MRNWAGNVTYAARAVHHPRSVDELQELVRRTPRLRALGSRHSFNGLADTTGDLVALDALPRTLELDRDAGTATVDGGVRYGDVCGPLDAAGFALHNLASLPHISIAGACATGTHGSGRTVASLAAVVRAVELVRGDGELVRLEHGRDAAFGGAVVALGALGVVTRLTLDVEPAYAVRQDVYEDLPLAAAVEHLDELLGLARSVSLFTTWREPVFHQVWLKRRVDAAGPDLPPDILGARPATRQLHPIPGYPAEACTPQLGLPGPWHERLPHFRLDHTPSSGDELQSEWFVRAEDAAPALLALAALGPRIGPLVQVSEVRWIAASDLWLDPASGRDSVAFHVTWQPDQRAVEAVLPVIDAALEPFVPRVHWAKLFALPPAAIRAAYPRFDAWADLVHELDPDGRFRNAYLDGLLHG